MNRYKTVIVFVVAVFLSTLLAYALLNVTFQISNVGRVVTFGVECDVSSIDWGMLLPGDSMMRTIHVRADGSLPISKLSFQTENMPVYLHLSWDYNGSTVTREWYPITFMLRVDEMAPPGDFNFTIVIVAEN